MPGPPVLAQLGRINGRNDRAASRHQDEAVERRHHHGGVHPGHFSRGWLVPELTRRVERDLVHGLRRRLPGRLVGKHALHRRQRLFLYGPVSRRIGRAECVTRNARVDDVPGGINRQIDEHDAGGINRCQLGRSRHRDSYGLSGNARPEVEVGRRRWRRRWGCRRGIGLLHPFLRRFLRDRDSSRRRRFRHSLRSRPAVFERQARRTRVRLRSALRPSPTAGTPPDVYQIPAPMAAAQTHNADSRRGIDIWVSFESRTIRRNRCRRRANAGAGAMPRSSANSISASIYVRRVPVVRTTSSSTTSSRDSCTRDTSHHAAGWNQSAQSTSSSIRTLAQSPRRA